MLTAGTQLGPYRIVAPLGAGGMGEVYRAHDPRLGRDVAIKVLPARSLLSVDARARFEREARTISQLSHPHICTLFDVGREAETDFLVMELLEGETLAHRIARGALPVADVLKLGAEIASALDRAHAAGVVHRDLKPANVMLTKSGAKLMDFGLARVAAAPGSASGAALTASPTMTQPLTGEGAIVGTFEYMAPEQLEGREADARSDIWALGCVLYEMATGKRAFGGASGASLIAAIMQGEPRPLSELAPLSPPALEHVVARCLAKDPAERWQSARDVVHALEMTRSASGAAIARAAKPSPRGLRAWWSLGAGLFACVVTAAITFLAIPRRLPQPTYSRITFQRGRISNARFSPDGKTVLYSATWSGDSMDVFEVDPTRLTTRSLGLRGLSLTAVSAENELAVGSNRDFTNEASLFRPVATLPLAGGAPHEVADGVSVADFARDGRTLAIVRREEGEIRIEMPPGHVIAHGLGQVSRLRVSPDGRHIAFLEHEYTDMRGRVVVVDRQGRAVLRTRQWADVRSLCWASSSREVWFGAQTGADPVHAICAVALDGRVRDVLRGPDDLRIHDVSASGRVLLSSVTLFRQMIAETPQGRRDLSWKDFSVPIQLSADGRTLLFSEMGLPEPEYGIYLSAMNGSPPTRIGEGPALALSPDGCWVLVRRFGEPQRLTMLPVGRGDSVQVPAGPLRRYDAAGWLPDGKRLVFAGSESKGASRIYVQALPDGPPRAITPPGATSGTDFRVVCSPDGRWVAGLTSSRELVLYPVDGGSPRTLGPLRDDEWITGWSTDGANLYSYLPGVTLTVLRTDARTGRKEIHRRITLDDPAAASFDFCAVSPDGGSCFVTISRLPETLFVVDGLK